MTSLFFFARARDAVATWRRAGRLEEGEIRQKLRRELFSILWTFAILFLRRESHVISLTLLVRYGRAALFTGIVSSNTRGREACCNAT